MHLDFSYDLTHSIGQKARLGLIVLQADETIEYELRRIFPQQGVSLYTTRIASGAEATSENLLNMRQDITSSASLLPDTEPYDVIGFACTSASALIGPSTVETLVKEAQTAKAVTNPLDALIAACAHLNIKKLAFLSPYVADVSSGLRASLEGRGIDIPFVGSFNEASEAKVARISGDSVREAALKLVSQGEVDGVFLSCTNLQSFAILDEIERACGCAVLSSNAVLAWHMFSLAGLDTKRDGMGRLFS